MRTTWNFRTPAQIQFGPGALQDLGEQLRSRGLTRVLVITDQNLVEAGIESRVRTVLQDADVDAGLFADGQAEPSIEIAVQAANQARSFEPQAILGLGGGSNMDLAKIVAILVTHGGHPRDYFGFNNVPGPVLPLVCLPTTAGTGSEVSHSAVLTDTEEQMKVSSLSYHIRPSLAVVDPELTYTCPPQITAESGIDALVHAIEAYSATDYQKIESSPSAPAAYEGRFPLGECLAERAIALIGKHLVPVVQDGDNHESRNAMALAATLAGMAFSNCGVALVHAMEYPMGGALHCSHGAGNGMLLPHVMRFNLPACTPAYARVAELLGEDTQGVEESAAAERAITKIEEIRREIGIPQRIRDLGGTPIQIPLFAEKTCKIDRLLQVNPREVTRKDLMDIMKMAF